MKHGRIVEHGTYQELLARGVDFHAEVEEGQVPQLSEPAADLSDSSQPVIAPVQSSPAAANGAVSNGEHEGQQAQEPKQASSPQQAGGQGAKEAKQAATPSPELAKGDLIKVLCGWSCSCPVICIGA